MFGFCFMLGKRCRQFFSLHRHTMCGNRRVSSASLVFVAILFVRATSKKNLPVTVHPLLYADCTFNQPTAETKCSNFELHLLFPFVQNKIIN